MRPVFTYIHKRVLRFFAIESTVHYFEMQTLNSLAQFEKQRVLKDEETHET